MESRLSWLRNSRREDAPDWGADWEAAWRFWLVVKNAWRKKQKILGREVRLSPIFGTGMWMNFSEYSVGLQI